MNAKVVRLSDPSNDAAPDIASEKPYAVRAVITGNSDLIFHRWSCEGVAEKSKAKKNSVAKKTDNVESYVWRDEAGFIGLPGEYLRQAIIHAAKFRQDPRSPRKSAMDLYKAGIVSETMLGSLGKKEWDYEDRRRAVVQRNGINRVRPAFRAGWTAEFVLLVLTPEYISHTDLQEVLTMAGRLVGVGDFRPTYGRFVVSEFKRI